MKVFALLLPALIAVAGGGAQARKVVELRGVVPGDMTIGGPGVTVRVRQPVTVPDKVVLKVQPGTAMKFDPGAGLTISGDFSAPGTRDQPIAFTASDRRRGWEGIVLNSGTMDVSWCVVSLSKVGLNANGKATVRQSAFVRNVVGMKLNGRSLFEDTAILRSLEDGVVGFEGSRGPDTFKRVTIADSGGIGYHGTHKGFPLMDMCVITRNRGGGFKGDNMVHRGSPLLTNSNVYDNAKFDIWLDRGDSYKFRNVYVGKQSSEKLGKDPNALVRNIIDIRRTKRQDSGIVIIEGIPTKPVTDAGAPREVVALAASYGGKGRSSGR